MCQEELPGCQPSAEGRSLLHLCPVALGGAPLRGGACPQHTQAERAPFSEHPPWSLGLNWDSTVSPFTHSKYSAWRRSKRRLRAGPTCAAGGTPLDSSRRQARGLHRQKDKQQDKVTPLPGLGVRAPPQASGSNSRLFPITSL